MIKETKGATMLTGFEGLVVFSIVTVLTLSFFWVAGKFFPGKWLD